MKRFVLVLVIAVALLTRDATAAAPAADAPATEPQSPEPPADEPPAADEQAPPQAPGPATPPPPPRRPHRRGGAPPPKHEQGKDPAPPRLVIPPQEPGAAGIGVIMNRTLGCNTLLVFGDSTVDPGNNNHLQTTARANFLPYGLNFFGRRPTGRFTNGRLATDMIAERLGIARTIPGFLDPNLRLVQLRRGVSFASGGSGYDDNTANRLNAMSLSAQVRNLFRYRLLIRTLLGPRRAERLVNRATFIISTGTNDMLSAYLASNRSTAINTAAYENYLIARVANYTQVMSMLGGRRFIFVGLPPMGCLPIVRTLIGTGSQRCDARLNQLAMSFNSKLLQLLNIINSQNHIKTSYIDAYTVINDATTDPNKFGLSEVARGCCGSGVIEISQTCRGRRTCGDPTKYLYWDAIHPTERTNQLVADAMMDSIRQLYA
ncbi:hypothetical protein PR202_gb18234 [Eleusine coracana subsp. coracana]|uniref:GDSL esterase/lipase n=1 Tax=Eleusine coracana subsp. coracana TaxID=191504 RepID=A0AAV5F2S6_ELECO|nr:hypothetical protein QOZ80_6BG0457620 [Eleusine coracana subsp. coracana]GJN29964.1 hypothetical protein PR202_gb18234 [Eleusine coracana subsp. coracana]